MPTSRDTVPPPECPQNCRDVPGNGQILAFHVLKGENRLMADTELVVRIASSTGLSTGEAARVVADVVAYFSEPAEDFVRRRHAHHQAYGMRNAEIFASIRSELAQRVVAGPELSERQLRRIVYG